MMASAAGRSRKDEELITVLSKVVAIYHVGKIFQ